MNASELNELLTLLPTLHLAVLGDFCLDAYWMLDLTSAQTSMETSLPTRPVRRQRYSLGGAGNVADNLVAMGVGRVSAFGVIGDDPFGNQMRRLFHDRSMNLDGLLTQRTDWDTPVYIKPMREENEENRLDFGNFNHLQDTIAAELLSQLERALPSLDALIINEQLQPGIHSDFLQAELNRLIARYPKRLFVVDSRHLSGNYPASTHKLNAHEAAVLCGAEYAPGEVVGQTEVLRFAEELWRRWKHPVFVTHGSRGCVVADVQGVQAVNGLHIARRIDPVGAGDSLLAGATAALAAGYSPLDAATFGNFVAGVTVQKIFQTGTATPDEIRAIGESPDYV
jgi:bifunctional ADP-heptose synthase (sugar kinase/adenylyltransferase)